MTPPDSVPVLVTKCITHTMEVVMTDDSTTQGSLDYIKPDYRLRRCSSGTTTFAVTCLTRLTAADTRAHTDSAPKIQG